MTLNFSPSNPALELSEQVQAVLDAALVEDRKRQYDTTRGSGEGQVAKKRIGSGYIGLECTRALAYRYHRAEREEREGPVGAGELKRHGEAGHWTEKFTAEQMRMAGFDLLTHRQDNPEKQIGFLAAKDPESGQYRVTVAVVLDRPEAP